MLTQALSIQLAIMGMPGGWEWIIILVIALLIFGRKLPEVGKGLGKGLVEFKKGLKGVKDELDEVDREVKDAVDTVEKETKQLEADVDAQVNAEVSERPKADPVEEKSSKTEA